MLKNEVIKLVHEDAGALLVCELLEEGRVVNHLEIAVLIDADAGSGHRGASLLLDATRKRGEEGLCLKQAKHMVIKIEVGHRVLRRHRVHK